MFVQNFVVARILDQLMVGILAPVLKKPGAGPAPKSGTGFGAKSSGIKPTHTISSSSKPSSSGIASKAPSVPSTSFGKSYNMAPAMGTQKKTTLSLLWIPSRRHNHKKETVWNPNNYSNYKERAPSMYSSHL